MRLPLPISGVKGRLIGLMALVILPIVLASVLFASGTYRQNLRAIEQTRAQIASDFVIRARVWLRGASRALLATYASIGAGQFDQESCSTMARAAVQANPGYRAILLSMPNDVQCVGTLDPKLDGKVLGRIMDEQEKRAPARSVNTIPFVPVRYDVVEMDGRRMLAIHLTAAGAEDKRHAALLLADVNVIDSTFEVGALEGAIIGLIKRGGSMLAVRGVPNADTSWLPADPPPAVDFQRYDGLSRAGDNAVYALASVSGTDLEVIARFDDQSTAEAWRQYLVMTLTPVIASLVLFCVYIFALQRDVIRWILGIKLAARARIENAHSRQLAPIGDDMPRELRSVATAFNKMVDDSHDREVALNQTLQHNRFLMRELHHRVKNSLQVIQSYLSLAQRELGRARRSDLAETEARVLVLSVSYRLALTDGGMQPVSLRALSEEIVASLASSMRSDNQWVSLKADVDAALVVDRSIPFGLAIVEGVIAALRSPGCEAVTVQVQKDDSDQYLLIISAEYQTAAQKPNARIMQGLALQLQATPLPLGAHDVLRWQFATT